ncbi:hypothetical protein AB0M72_10295 [Nocardiopsis dassonvillei]
MGHLIITPIKGVVDPVSPESMLVSPSETAVMDAEFGHVGVDADEE